MSGTEQVESAINASIKVLNCYRLLVLDKKWRDCDERFQQLSSMEEAFHAKGQGNTLDCIKVSIEKKVIQDELEQIKDEMTRKGPCEQRFCVFHQGAATNYPPSQQGKDGQSMPPPNEVAPPSNIPKQHGDYSKPDGPVQDQYHMGSYPQQPSQPPYSDHSQYPYRHTGVSPQSAGSPQQNWPRESRSYSSGQNQYPPGQQENGKNASPPGGAARSRYGGPQPESSPHHMGSSMGPKMKNRWTGYGPDLKLEAINKVIQDSRNAIQRAKLILDSLKWKEQLRESQKAAEAVHKAQMAQKFANQFQQNAAQFGNIPVNNLLNQQQININFQPMMAANIPARFPQFNMNIGGAQANFKPGDPGPTMTPNLSELYKSAQKTKFTTPNSGPVITESETNEPAPSNNTHSTVKITEIE